MNQPSGDADRLMRRLANRRALARAAILVERVWPALWPPLGVFGLFLCAALLDLPRLLSPTLHLAALAGTALAVLVLTISGLARIRAPAQADADRRLERASGLSHRPLAVLADGPAQADAAGLALWQAHVARTVRELRRLRVGLPRPGLARLDPRALRGALVVGLVAAFAIAGSDAPFRLAIAFTPQLPGSGPAAATELQAWITPPGYTRLPPVFLKPDSGGVSVPAGSHLTISLTGASNTPVLALAGVSEPFRALDKTSYQADRDLTQGGRLTVRRDGRELAGWDLAVVADQPPTAAWTEPPGRAPASQQLRLPWQVGDDYGVVGLQAELHMKERPDAPALVVALPLPGGAPKAAHGVSQHDLTAHPWAGLEVTAKLIARDAAGQTGESETANVTLPQRLFQNPLARALITIRRGLSLHPEDRDTAVNGLDAMLMGPDEFHGDLGAYLNLGAIYYLLEFDHSAQAIDQAQRRLWELALHLEEGQTERTAKALDEARQAARDALDKATRDPTNENRSELERRLQALRDAIDRHMQALLEEARRNNSETPFDPDAATLSGRDLDRMAEAARKAAREGRMDEAQQRVAELERMLDQLRNARAGHGQANQRSAQQRQKGRQEMGALQDLVGREGGLLDHAQRRADDAGPLTDEPDEPGEPAQQDAERQADQRVQHALRRALGELMQQFGDLTAELPPSLGEADTQMREAARQLGQGQDKAAGDAQQRAIQALQKGGGEMGQAMAKQFGSGQPGESGEDGSGMMGFGLQDGDDDGSGFGTLPGQGNRHGRGQGRDPLGRSYGQGSSGADEDADVTVPEERERQRTQAIEEELRRRGGQRDRPQQELDYIDRLLKQF